MKHMGKRNSILFFISPKSIVETFSRDNEEYYFNFIDECEKVVQCSCGIYYLVYEVPTYRLSLVIVEKFDLCFLTFHDLRKPKKSYFDMQFIRRRCRCQPAGQGSEKNKS